MMSSMAVHEPDTPVSSGSPASLGVADGVTEGSKFNVEDAIRNDKKFTSTSSPISNHAEDDDEDGGAGDNESGSSLSPRSASTPSTTPKLSFTPPTNGMLTPPNDFVEGSSCDVTKSGDNSNGRLKFYKDGILCLELSHHEEGKRTKWIQIKTKTVFPTTIHTKKEAVIPRHISPSTSYPSPTGSCPNSLQPRIESSASHSTSDDGSSMLSSPRIRESSWKKSVPRKSASTDLQFYFKAAFCARITLSRFKSQMKTKLYHRKPCTIIQVFQVDLPSKLKNEESQNKSLCECETGNGKGTANQADPGDTGDEEKSEECTTASDKPRLLQNEETSKMKSSRKKRSPILTIIDRLNSQQLKYTTKPKSSGSELQQASSRNYVLPKKRMFNEVEPKDSSSPYIRPKKSSPNKPRNNNNEKTILNIPGLNSDFYKRYTDADMNGDLDKERTLNLSKLNSKQNGKESSKIMIGGGNSGNINKFQDSSSRQNLDSDRRHHHQSSANNKQFSPSSSRSSSKSQNSRRNSTSPKINSSSNIGIDFSSAAMLHNSSPHPSKNNAMNAMSISSLPLKEQKLFQQQTMSKAISYTINSLLNNPCSQESSNNNNSLLIPKMEPSDSSKKSRKSGERIGNSNYYPGSEKLKNSPTANSRQHEEMSAALYGLRGDNDQNSFLRHLLDTSDPIPKKEKSPPTVRKSQSNNNNAPHPHHGQGGNHRSSGSSSSKKEKSSSSPIPIPRSDSTGSNKDYKKQTPTKPAMPLLNPTIPQNIMEMYQQQSAAAAASFLHPSLMGGGGGGGFPLPMSAYESLLAAGGRDSSLGALAAAAAAEFQFLSNLNSPMAAAFAASYLGGIPNPNNNPPNINPRGSSASSSRSPPVHHQHPNSSPSPASYGSNSGSPLNLSQRNWLGGNGLLPNSTGGIPIPFHAPSGDSLLHSRSSGENSRGHGRRDKSDNYVDPDVPLNLSKKSKQT